MQVGDLCRCDSETGICKLIECYRKNGLRASYGHPRVMWAELEVVASHSVPQI